MMLLYHGSNMVIDTIDLSQCHPYKDFGQAFYLTTDKLQAQDIAGARVDFLGGEPIINTFCFDETLLADVSLSFKSFEGYTQEWAEFIYKHRDESLVPPYKHAFDVVYGPIANDRVGLQIRNYRLDKKQFFCRCSYL